MSSVESVRFYAMSADPNVAAIVLVDLLYDPSSGVLEWALRPVPATETDAPRYGVTTARVTSVPALMTLLRRYLAAASTR